MAVINTTSLLFELVDKSNGVVGEELVKVHRNVLCEPIKDYFPQNNIEDIQMDLLAHGLFNPTEIRQLNRVVEEFNRGNTWLLAQKEFEKLRELWNGIDIPIYLYPLTTIKHPSGNKVFKNGVTYPSCIFLFVTEGLEEGEIKALVAHEYHHACRLAYLNKNTEEMELIDSLILEGMAEYTVEKLYGSQYLSPWIKRYSSKQLKKQWEKNFISKLDLLGVQNHFPYLYGTEMLGLPKWIGYCLGYQLIKTFADEHRPYNLAKLLREPTNEILKVANFN